MTIYEFVNQFQRKSLTEVSLPGLYSTAEPFYTFSGQTRLTTAYLPDLRSAGQSFFASCYSLTSVYLPKLATVDGYTFHNCTRLESVDLPNLRNIQFGMFSGCVNLTSITAPKATTIGQRAFVYCSRLEYAEFPNVTALSSSAFESCWSLRELRLPKIVQIGNPWNAYGIGSRLSALSHLYIPECEEIWGQVGIENEQISDLFSVIDGPKLKMLSVWLSPSSGSTASWTNLSILEHSALQSIRLFMNGRFPALSKLSFPEMLDFRGAYYGDGMGDQMSFPMLTHIYMPKVTSVYMLPNSPVLESLDIPWSEIEYVGPSLFNIECPFASTLTSINLPNCKKISSHAFGVANPYLETIDCAASFIYGFSRYSVLRAVSFPNCVRAESYTFTGCSVLTSIYMPQLVAIPYEFFTMNSAWESSPEVSVDFPAASQISDRAFWGNTRLTGIKLSVCKQILGTTAFAYCANLMSVYLYNSSMVALSGTATAVFAGTPIVSSVNGVYGSVYVPSSLVATYQANGNWAVIGQRITAIPE